MGARLRVASYNLHDFTDDPAAAARVVRAIAPDVLCLQEVPRRLLFGHRIADFAAACGLYWSGGSRGSGGTTVLTSLRVDAPQAGHERLPVRLPDRTRGYAGVRVRVPGHHPVTCVSVHLGLKAAERERHAATVLASRWAASCAPLVVAGDLNEGADGPAWRAFGARLRAVTADLPTFPSRAPDRRIDVIFASESLPVLDPAATDPVILEVADLRDATDHLPVWVDLDLTAHAVAVG